MSEAVPEALRIDVSPAAGSGPALVVLSGEMDVVSSPSFTEAMTELEQELPDGVVIDVAGLTFIDSSGINALLRAARTVEARGRRAVLAAPGTHVQRVFEITHVPTLVAVASDRDEALRLAAAPLATEALPDEA